MKVVRHVPGMWYVPYFSYFIGKPLVQDVFPNWAIG